jgi:hypothetical protein
MDFNVTLDKYNLFRATPLHNNQYLFLPIGLNMQWFYYIVWYIFAYRSDWWLVNKECSGRVPFCALYLQYKYSYQPVWTSHPV